MAFNDAVSDILAGRIDYAVVGGASNIFRPQTSLAFQRIQMLSPDVSLAAPLDLQHCLLQGILPPPYCLCCV